MSTPQQDQSQLSDDLAVAAGASPHHEAPAHASQLGQPLLQVRDLQVAYGQIEAVKGISFDLPLGRITTLVGANGAGKSTTLLALSGLVKKAGGSVDFDGQDLSAMAPHRIVRSGVVQVAEGRATLPALRSSSASPYSTSTGCARSSASPPTCRDPSWCRPCRCGSRSAPQMTWTSACSRRCRA